MIKDSNFNSHAFLAANFTYDKSSIVIIGCPLDSTATFRPGTRFAPQAIREASWGLETYSPRLDRDLEDLKICDVGDLILSPGDLEGALGTIEQYITTVTGEGKLPILMGGEHLITLPTVRTYARKYPDLLVVHVDAHADLRHDYEGEPLSHATVMKRITDLIGRDNICQIGIRSGTREEMRAAHEMRSLCEAGEVLRRAERRSVYLTVDLDILDPAVAPGVSTPEPGGITFHELISLIEHLDPLRVVGIDLVELCPPYDPTQQSAIAAAKILRELILQFCYN